MHGGSELQARLTAQVAWEAECERVRKTINPPVGYPGPQNGLSWADQGALKMSVGSERQVISILTDSRCTPLPLVSDKCFTPLCLRTQSGTMLSRRRFSHGE